MMVRHLQKSGRIVCRNMMALALSVGLGALSSVYAQSLTWLNLYFVLGVGGVSADGRVVVGSRFGNPRYGELSAYVYAFRWVSDFGAERLPTLGFPGRDFAYDVSADGRVVVGASSNRAYRWVEGQGMADLGTLSSSEARGVSADGTVVVGWSINAGNYRAFRWQTGVMQDLGTLGGAMSAAYDVSADGRIVVGTSSDISGQRRAFRWIEGQGMENLGTLPYGGESVAYGVSADGRVVVGTAADHAFRWVEGQGMEDLGTLGGDWSEAYGVSADGRIVVGVIRRLENQRDHRYYAFRWIEGRGMEDLNQTYASLLTDGSSLDRAKAISPDGRYIVGYGYNARTRTDDAFLLDTWRTGDTNGDGCIDDADLLNVLFAFGTPGTGYTRHEDINKDGIVDDADLLTVLFRFGDGC